MTINLCCQILISPNDPRVQRTLLNHGITVPAQETVDVLFGLDCVETSIWEEPEECTVQDACCGNVYSSEYNLVVN